ncbi:hypothetical protein BLD48_08150 [Exiguobacterium sp. KRL4]|uniref:hypothetical protein n=1 Tax=Exiguobacterium sp. KRL4 TaxID=1914536 RepID=UPI0008F8D665|nr:hypothetical protein [Exiguobacterium sp. KRL4]OIN66917.1 hypothetical protein BLD48_08150 [Exiguobacterium sp. KRL4]
MNNIDLDFLLSVEDYELELDTMSLNRNDHFAIDMYFYGADDSLKLLIDDPSRDYFLMRFEKYAVFTGTLQEHGIIEEGLRNPYPVVKLKESVFGDFAEKHMKTKEIYTERGELNLFVIRTFDQEFYILSYSEPIVINNIAKSE